MEVPRALPVGLHILQKSMGLFIDRILTKLDRGYVSDQTPFKYFFTNLGISMGCESWKRASYLHMSI